MADPTSAERSGLADDNMRFYLACGLIGGFWLFVLMLIFWKLLTQDMITFELGQISGFVGSIVFFYWGSSSGSKMKTMQVNPDNKIVTSVPTSEATTTTVKTENKE